VGTPISRWLATSPIPTVTWSSSLGGGDQDGYRANGELAEHTEKTLVGGICRMCFLNKGCWKMFLS